MSTWLDRALALGRAQPADPSPRFVPVSPMAAGVPVTQDSALTLATVFACVRAIAEDIAGLPWQGLRRNGERREPTDDMDALLNVSASEEVSAFDFRAALLSHALTWGNGYAEIVRNGKGQARELVLLTPERVDPRRDAMGRLVYEVAQPNSGERVTIPAADMFHVRGLSRSGRIIATRADLTKSGALRQLADVLGEAALPVHVMYMSNAEQYFAYRPVFRANVQAWPASTKALVLRTRPMARDYTYVVQPLDEFREQLARPEVRSVRDLAPKRVLTAKRPLYDVPRDPPMEKPRKVAKKRPARPLQAANR